LKKQVRYTTHAVTEEPVSFDEFDEMNDARPEPVDFELLAEWAISRRAFLGHGVAFGAVAFVMGTAGLTPSVARAAARRTAFEPVAANALDTVTVPPGYDWHVVARWGEPMWSDSIPFDQSTRGSGASQERAFGDNNDGMSLFDADGRSVLAVNNEYVNRRIIYGGSGAGGARERRRRSQGQGGPWRLHRRDRPDRRSLVDRRRLAVEPAHHRGHPDADHRTCGRPRSPEDRGGSDRHQLHGHVEQLRQRPHPVGKDG